MTRNPPEPSRLNGSDDIRALYDERFTEQELRFKRRSWEVLCKRVFQPLVGEEDTVVDLGAGRCEFINTIKAAKKVAVDINPQIEELAEDAVPLVTSSVDMGGIETSSVDVVFSSNFLEHLPSKDVILDTLAECGRILRPGGSLILLLPNIRYAGGRYWDYFDHHIPLTHLSVVESLRLRGFEPVRVVPRFIPYTVKSRWVPKRPIFLDAYLRLRFLWPIFGKQMLVVARRAER